ncbi:MAG: DNA primase [Candidatus Pacebacteria bacterium]|nr:DNA primase [Candidatus Paceibacterota bacterium]
MQDSSVDEIKSKLSIEDVVGGYLQLQRAGRNLKACCPFHNEKSPSFIVSPERQTWHCFGCGEGGDIFSFVMKIEGVEFIDSLKLLAEKAGVQLQKTEYRGVSEKGVLLEIVDLSKRFYRECLKIKGGKKAYEYLEGRGISGEIITKFELGFAPDSWHLLSEYLIKKGFKEKDILLAGMAVKNEKGKVYDRFRGRIMFPINNISGQTIGFSSRVMPGGDESSAKYINTPETPIYNKGRVLYGLDKSKIPIRQKDQCIMVEGNVDVIASFQAGVENVTATSGTALTEEQLRIIKRYTNNIVFSFDMDAAGVKASGRGIDMALAEGMNVSVIRVPGDKDPADCVKSDPELWRSAAEKTIKVMDFYFESVFDKYDKGDIEGKKKIAQELLTMIARISNRIEQSFYLQKLSSEIGIEENVLEEVLRETNKRQKTGGTERKKTEASPVKVSREFKLQESLLGLVIASPEKFSILFGELDQILEDEIFLNIYNEIKGYYKQKGSLTKEDLEQIRKKIADKDSCPKGSINPGFVFDAAVFSIESHLDEEGFDLSKEAEKCVSSLKEIFIKRGLRDTELRIKKAEKENDGALLEKLFKEQSRLMDELGTIGF